MVCLGNICRSPIAHGILQTKIELEGLEWQVDSAGTSGWHAGELPDPRSIQVAQSNGIDLTSQRSQKFESSFFETYDLIVAMDSSNYSNICALASDESQKEKVKLLMNYAYPGENRQVPDPYYEGGFQAVFDMINLAVDNLVDSFRK